MRQTILAACTLLCSLSGFTQRFDLDILGGVANYQGDLQPSIFTLQNARPAAAFIAKYGVTGNLFARMGFTFGSIAAFDSKNRSDLRFRNLDFQSRLQEFHAGIEYRFFKPERVAITPYIFGGVGVFHFNPFTNYNGEKVFLQPLGTEGQGLSAYPTRKVYQLTQFCIPYGGGIKWQVNCNLNVGLELRQTKTFTDYLDDVSTSYVDANTLLAGRGPLAVELAWRADELNGAPYPGEGRTRGNPKENDWYYVAGLTVGLKINDCESGLFSLGGLFNKNSSGPSNKGGRKGKGGRGSVSCPKW